MHMSALVIALIVSLMLLANFYVGINYHKLIKKEDKKPLIFIYWVVHVILVIGLVLNFILFFTGNHFGKTALVVEYIAAYTAGFFFYSIFLFVLRDAVRLLSRVVPFPHITKRFCNALYRGGLIVLTIAMIVTTYGVVNAKNYKVVEYDVTLEKKESTLDKLNVAFISDAHLGSAINAANLQKIVDKINATNPDVVLFGGDIFDDGTSPELKAQASEIFKGINAEYGSYYVIGNHESYLEDHAKDEGYFTAAGVKVINDEVITVPDKFILVGRQDLTGGGREDMLTLMQNVDTKSLPIIVLDHEPTYKDMKESAVANADLQLSGHTHDGQIFPTRLIDFLGISPSYGEYKVGNLQTIISSGVGAWGVPLKVGSPSEIMSVNIKFS